MRVPLFFCAPRDLRSIDVAEKGATQNLSRARQIAVNDFRFLTGAALRKHVVPFVAAKVLEDS